MSATRYIACKVIAIFLAVVAIVGNVLVCHLIVRLKIMKNSINYIILNLAVMDATIGLLAIPYVFVHDSQGVFGEQLISQVYNRSSTLANIICKASWTIWFPYNVSPLLLMIMAYERFKAIVHPLSRFNDTTTKSRLKWMLPLAWMLGAVYVILDMIILQYDWKSVMCVFVSSDMPSWYSHQFVSIAYVCTQLIIPANAIVVFYCCIFCALRKEDNALGPQAEARRARRKAAKKVMWNIIVVTVLFYICCGIPNAFYIMYAFYWNLLSDTAIMSDIEMVLATFNSAFNPLVYFLFMQSFKDGFKRVYLSRQQNTPSIDGLELHNHPRRSMRTELENEPKKRISKGLGNELYLTNSNRA